MVTDDMKRTADSVDGFLSFSYSALHFHVTPPSDLKHVFSWFLKEIRVPHRFSFSFSVSFSVSIASSSFLFWTWSFPGSVLAQISFFSSFFLDLNISYKLMPSQLIGNCASVFQTYSSYCLLASPRKCFQGIRDLTYPHWTLDFLYETCSVLAFISGNRNLINVIALGHIFLNYSFLFTNI